MGKKISSFNDGIQVVGAANGGESTRQVSSPRIQIVRGNLWRNELTSSNEKQKKKRERNRKKHIKLLPSNERRKEQFDRQSKDELSKIQNETKRGLFPRIVVKKKKEKRERKEKKKRRKNAGAVNWLDCVSRDIRVSRGSR